MPRLWNDTVETHRQAVREAIFRAVHTQIRERGLAGVTMSAIAADAGIGRATLYKYFPDVGAILDAVHELHINEHLEQLSRLAEGDEPVSERLESVLVTYAEICTQRRRHGDPEVTSLLHRPEVIDGADARLRQLFGTLIEEAQQAGAVRDDATPETLASFCLQALAAGDAGPTARGTVSPLVRLTLDGLRAATD